jgi:hypothetical protein
MISGHAVNGGRDVGGAARVDHTSFEEGGPSDLPVQAPTKYETVL